MAIKPKTIYCHLDGNYHNKMTLSRMLGRMGIDTKEYYDNHLFQVGDGICKNCGRETLFTKMAYRPFCNQKCSVNFNKPYEKYHRRMAEDPSYRDEVMKRMTQTRKERYPDFSVIHAKREITYLERYGMTISQKRSQEQHEMLAAFASEEERFAYYSRVTAKKKRYGGYKYYDYVLNGETVKVQGYEPHVLDVLKKVYDENRIAVKKRKMIPYRDEDGRLRNYIPDIVVDGNILFEVKSEYTLKKNYGVTMLKLASAKAAGYTVVLVVWDLDNAEQLEKTLIETISSQALMCEGRFNDYPFIGVGFK